MTLGFSDMMYLAQCDYKTCAAMEQHFPDEYAVRAAAYHIHQAVEKSLKAIILYNGENPAFTHNIGKLLAHCQNLGVQFSENSDMTADMLTLWELRSKYDPYELFTLSKYKKAKAFYEEISNILKTYSPTKANYDKEENEDKRELY